MAMDIWAVIPARSGSKRVVGKNMRYVNGHPLVYWSIMRALQSKLITRTIVTTDSAAIARIAQGGWDKEVTVVSRPDELCGDTASTDDTIVHAVLSTARGDDYSHPWGCRPIGGRSAEPQLVVLLQPTVPARSEKLIDECITAAYTHRADALLTVSRLHFVWWQREHYVSEPHGGPSSWVTQCHRRPPSQDMRPGEIVYHEDGSVYVSRWDVMRETLRRISGKVHCHEGDEGVVDIDTEDDLATAALQTQRLFGSPIDRAGDA